MINTITIISITAAIFFIIACIILLIKKSKEHNLRIHGCRTLAKRTRKLKSKRESQLREIALFKSLDDANFEKLWLAELEFYQNTSEIICDGNDKNIKKMTTYVSNLLAPLLDILNTVPCDNPDVQGEVQDDIKQLTTKYQALLEQNQSLRNEIESLQGATNTVTENIRQDPNEQALTCINDNLQKLMNHFNLEHHIINEFDSLKVDKSFDQIINTIEQQIQDMSTAKDSNDSSHDIIDQLRKDKIDFLKKYRKAMSNLYKFYNEYAGAFGLAAPDNPHIEIEDFENFISENT